MQQVIRTVLYIFPCYRARKGMWKRVECKVWSVESWLRESDRIRQLPQSPRLRMEVLATHEESLWGAAWYSNDNAWLAELPRFHEFGKWPLGQLCIRVFKFIRGAFQQMSAEAQSTCLTVVKQTLPILGDTSEIILFTHTKLFDCFRFAGMFLSF